VPEVVSSPSKVPAAPKAQTSNFSTAPASKSEAKAKELGELTQSKKKEESADDGQPKVMLKKIIRSRRGIRS
jgi:hypothetical protein